MAQKISLPITGVLLLVVAVGVVGGSLLLGSPKAGEAPSLFGIPLVPPIFAQSGGATFPDPQAGISSYIQRDPDLIDFDTIISLFDETVDSGDNYIIGAFNMPRRENTDPIHTRVYVDKDGFIIAYLTKDKLAADIFRWQLADPPADPLDTALSDTLTTVTDAIGAPPPTDASWYHWSYPSATHFSAAAKKGVGNMYMRIPDGAVFSENPSYSWRSDRGPFGFSCCGTSGALNLYDPDEMQTILQPHRNIDIFNVQELPTITPGSRYRFELESGSGGSEKNFLGVAIVYRMP
ncbi:MAG: hypothetical protein A3J30_03645 [Candidatus Wildermuthbacteria bacterium RIFCSPLOWO2_02_FULL_47_9c]|uniref:Uncharacterized protein n=1 Tax=Candidatus Wildermuthbacteria bacterium RIFCSPLOWO2_02_FULL_47_9c TaxID=1802466 RepID=A0A1G2RXA2_9BACT|nr:MAG: hypothetical protein UY38_C0002G0217 [Parcubacteria group bacterium GW2011_GWB1_49_12]KKW08835.1 MAG: hypothetical protein UY45_C0003G0042 [Parcubacteria group bacterium GW2011_GWA1_49_26]KKW13849.1 MAG: hypothetical protein UY53_C0006G0034 [Parcubacteria group bacterium GW2011_GWA2_50_10]OHA61759.1 MAG: hypothetical protein A2109_00220 [Candidatus Wildermuthbacteria bacterium GWA1_49_26]OHA65586.1 MAG: hypothetical protein A2674_03135 [Candidatus Wildermuthbacteria bacterium RIFCSPHIGH